jgi:hypothetical protein
VFVCQDKPELHFSGPLSFGENTPSAFAADVGEYEKLSSSRPHN